MKKLHLFLMIGLLASLFSCEDKNNGYKGTNYIYLSTQDSPVIIESDTEAMITIDVDLTASLKEDVILNFEFIEEPSQILKMEGNPVSIKAGEKKASFKILSNNKNILSAEQNIKIGINVLPDENLELKEQLTIKVKPDPQVPELTDAQKTMIEGYKEKFGINLYDYIGVVPCTVKILSPAGGSLEAFVSEYEKNITGKTVITLSEKATADKPILKMVDNPMGLEEYLYDIFKKETILNKESWVLGESPRTNYECMMAAINLTATSEETFEVTLDNLEMDFTNKTVKFVSTVLDSYESEIGGIDYQIKYSAWDRLKAMADKGLSIETESGQDGAKVNELVTDLISYGVTLEPFYFLRYSDINEDTWGNEPSDWIAPTAVIDTEAKQIKYEFTFDHYSAGGYTRIYLTYGK